MKATVELINLIGITRDDARELRNEINKLTESNLVFKKDQYPQLYELDKILSGLFDSMKHEVHFISKH